MSTDLLSRYNLSDIDRAEFIKEFSKKLFLEDWTKNKNIVFDVVLMSQAAVQSASTLWDEIKKELTKRER